MNGGVVCAIILAMTMTGTQKIRWRVVADIILFLSIFFAPWYYPVFLGVLFIILFSSFWEAVVAGFIMDALYHIPAGEGIAFYHRFGVFTLSALFLTVISVKIKKQLRI